ncbi:MAG: CHAT domain-containing tetratricopeptide repeat protein [Steroidobacteraceae bacterium]
MASLSQRRLGATGHGWRWLLTICLIAGCSPDPARWYQVVEVQQDQQLGADNLRRYPVALTSGERLLLRVSQHTVDVSVTLDNEIGETLISVNSATERAGREYLYFEAQRDGKYEVVIRLAEPEPAVGRFNIETLKLRPDAPTALVDGLKHYTRASRAAMQTDPKQWREALNDYDAAYKALKPVDPRAAADAAFAAANLSYLSIEDWAPALQRNTTALSLYRKVGDTSDVAYSLRLDGMTRQELALASRDQNARDLAKQQLVDAEHSLAEARKKFDDAGRTIDVAAVDNLRAIVAYHRYDYESAQRLAQRAETALSATDDMTTLQKSQNTLAIIAMDRGDFHVAAATFGSLTEQARASVDITNEIVFLQNQAVADSSNGDYQTALQLQLQSLELAEEHSDRVAAARALRGIGGVYLNIGSYAQAIDNLQQAVSLSDASGNTMSLIQSSLLLGNALRDSGRLSEARDAHERAVRLSQGLVAPISRANALLALAQSQRVGGALAPATDTLTDALALELPQSNVLRIQALIERAHVQRLRGDLTAAARDLQASEEANATNALPLEEVAMLTEQARLARAQRMPDEAERYISKGTAEINALQANTRNPSIRRAFMSRLRELNKIRTRLMTDDARRPASQGDGAERLLASALQSADRFRVHHLLDAAQAPRNRAATGARGGLFVDLAALQARLDALIAAGSADLDRIGDLQERIAAARARVTMSAQSLRETGDSPRVDDFSISQLQRRLEPSDRVLYFDLDESDSLAFTVSSDGIELTQLGPAQALNQAAIRLLEMTAKPSRRVPTPQDIATAAGPLRLPAFIDEHVKRLWIIADGQLHTVPWTLLAGSAEQGIALSASLESLAEATRAFEPERGGIALFADPVYESNDARLPAQLRETRDNDNDAGIANLVRLAGTRREADAVAVLFPTARVAMASGLEATATAAAQRLTEDFAIAHFAVHAIANETDPVLARLALSRFDADGRIADADLHAYQIADLAIRTQLIVLSACDSASGALIDGEGLDSLSSAFLRSGARQVLASLWPVPDAAAPLLMQTFYRQLLLHHDAALALRVAQARVAADKRFVHPFFWAGFRLTTVGDLGHARPH